MLLSGVIIVVIKKMNHVQIVHMTSPVFFVPHFCHCCVTSEQTSHVFLSFFSTLKKSLEAEVGPIFELNV